MMKPRSVFTRALAALAKIAASLALLLFVGVGVVSCAILPPAPGSIDGVDRLDALEQEWGGLGGEVTILWDEHLVPSVLAQNDDDAAYALGLVHAHLRLSQMEFFRRVSQGRLAEMAGPFVVDIDHAIRAIDLDRAVDDIERALPEPTLVWITRYVEGVNAYRESVGRVPPEARALGISFKEPWTVRDVLVLGRLLSVDVNWGRWLSLGRLGEEPGFDDYIARLWGFADDGVPSFGGESHHELNLLTDIGRSGSNAFVVSGARSASGGALVASDPHLGLPQPNIWCVVGYRTPEHQAVGLTIPGLPFVLVGRNERVAWTGTNMQSSSTTLYRLPDGWASTGSRLEPIGVRFWFDRERTVRESAWGPVITDAKVLGMLGEGDIAMRWRGHDPSDEGSAFFGASKSADWAQFREAFREYAVGGQNILYADAEGNIGQIMAIEAMPAAMKSSRTGVVDASNTEFDWQPGIPSPELPAAYNPAPGFIVSANNVPVRTDPVLVPQGNANDRVLRMTERLEGDATLTLDDLESIQQDVYSLVSHELAGELVERTSGVSLSGRARALRADLEGWDGHYTPDSRGALAYQIVLSELIDTLYEGRYAPAIIGTIRQAPYVHRFVLEDVRVLERAQTLAEPMDRAAKSLKPDQAWGDLHRVRLAHPLGFVPIIGSSYVFADEPTPGSTTTVHKSAHSVQTGRHATSFGANARLLCDMGTLDDNRVVLLGGQDGWMGSDRLLDQADLWFEGRTFPLPLSEEGQRGRAVRTVRLK